MVTFQGMWRNLGSVLEHVGLNHALGQHGGGVESQVTLRRAVCGGNYHHSRIVLPSRETSAKLFESCIWIGSLKSDSKAAARVYVTNKPQTSL